MHTALLLQVHFHCFVVITCTGGRGWDDKGVPGASPCSRVGGSSELLVKLEEVDGSRFLQMKLRFLSGNQHTHTHTLLASPTTCYHEADSSSHNKQTNRLHTQGGPAVLCGGTSCEEYKVQGHGVGSLVASAWKSCSGIQFVVRSRQVAGRWREAE